MDIRDTDIPEVKLVVQDRHVDGRGWFTRAWCARELATAGLDARLSQVNLSCSRRRGTVRGLHLQHPPHAESKLVHVVQGAIMDVAVDVRPGSPTLHRHVARELSADNGHGLFVPMGFAHGFQTLTDDVVVLYAMSDHHAPDAAAGFAHDDPAFGIRWPLPVTEISERDATYPHLARPEPGPAHPEA